MYQGKFNSGKKASEKSVYDLLEERKANQKKPAPRAAGQPPVPEKMPKAGAAARQQSAAPVRQASAVPEKPPRRLGGLIFWACFMGFVFVFYLATFVGLGMLRSWLVNYQAAQPTTKSQEIFTQLFDAPDWGELYDIAGMSAGSYEGKESFCSYMAEKVGTQELTFLETSAGLSGDKKYVVRLGDEKLATFTLEDLNGAQTSTDVPDWQLKNVEFFLESQEPFYIEMEKGMTASVNGVDLGDSQVIAISRSPARDYLPITLAVPEVHTLKVAGLISQPVVTIRDAAGAEQTVTYDAGTRTFRQTMASTEAPADRAQLALNAVKAYADFMSSKTGGLANLNKYFDKESSTYKVIVDTERNWVQLGASKSFSDEKVWDYRTYGDSVFSVRVSVTLNITRKEDGSVRSDVIEQSLFFTPGSNGNWMCYQMTSEDMSQWTKEVRLTFLNGDEILSDGFVPVDADEIQCPLVSAPEGKRFVGWMTESTDENGKQVMKLVLTPDETGKMTLGAGTELQSMVLQPHFEKAE